MAQRRKHLTCTLFFCNETHYALGLCKRHYQKYTRDKHHATEEDLDLVIRMAIEGNLPPAQELKSFLAQYGV
jgi:hypothetical protein